MESFVLNLEGLSADQPPGFGTGHIAGMKRVAVKTDRFDLRAPEAAVKQVLVQGPSASVIMNKEGRVNLQGLVEGLFGKQAKIKPEKSRW